MTKTEHVRKLLKNGSPDLTSQQIAKMVGCHDAYVRAVRGRMLHPDRERQYQNHYYATNPVFRERKLAWSREQVRRGLK